MNFFYPVPGNSIITQTYSEHLYRKAKLGLKNYNGGIDWAVPMGTTIQAAAGGKVIRADFTDVTGYGGHVRIQHLNGYITIYAHLSVITVKVGKQVEVGQMIGLSGNSGNSTGPHLHFEARVNDVPFDPYPYLVDPYPHPVGNEPVKLVVDKSFDGELPALSVVWAEATAEMYLRDRPSTTGNIIGWVPAGARYPIIEYVTDKNNLWARTGGVQDNYVAMYHGGKRYARIL